MNTKWVILILVLLSGCQQKSEIQVEGKPSPRFEWSAVGCAVPQPSLWVVTDVATGKEYLVNFHGGIIDLGTTNQKTR